MPTLAYSRFFHFQLFQALAV